MIRPGRPCKIFLDLDGKKEDFGNLPFTSESWEKILDYFEALVHSMITEQCSSNDIDRCSALRWYANRAEKFSSHLIFQYWVESASTLNSLMKKMKKLVSDEYSVFFDLNVYSPLAVKEMRLPYSGKMLENDTFAIHLPVIESNECQGRQVMPPRVNLEKFKASMLTAFHDPRFKLDTETLISKPNQLSPESRSLSVGLSDGGDETRSSVLNGSTLLTEHQKDLLRNWLTEQKDAGTVEETETDSEIKYLIHGVKDAVVCNGIWCPNIGRPHKSNGCSFTVKYIRTLEGGQLIGSFFCLDCKLSWLPETTVECVCFPERFPLRLSADDENKIHLFDSI
jgi:hypothetical protein